MSYLTEAYLELAHLVEQADSTDTQTRPMQFVRDLVGTIITPGMRVLDFGSGRHARNADYLRSKGVKCYAYDPHKATEGDGWAKGSVSEKLPGGLFDLVLSTYVLNVLKPDEAATALRQAEKCGKRQIHVVRDDLPKDKAAKGFETSRGFQRGVDLSSKGYKAERKGGSYVAWLKGVKSNKDDSVKESLEGLLAEMATAAKDIAVQKKAIAMFNKLSKMLRSYKQRHQQMVYNMGGKYEGIGVSGADLDQKYRELLFLMVPERIGRQEKIGGSFGQWEGNHKYRILLPVLPDDKGAEDVKRVDISKVRRMFVHEFVHYMDQKRWREEGGMFAKDKEGKNIHSTSHLSADYFNSPEEFNAYFQDGADSIRNAVDMAVKNDQIHSLRELFGSPHTFWNWSVEQEPASFNRNWIMAMRKKTHRHFAKRVHELYGELRKRTIKSWGKNHWLGELFPKHMKPDHGMKTLAKAELAVLKSKAKADQHQRKMATPKGGQIGLF